MNTIAGLDQDCSIGDAVRIVASHLAHCNVESSHLDARVLVVNSTNESLDAIVAHPDKQLSSRSYQTLVEFVARRVKGEPVARILACKEFWSLDFELNEATLVPRPETELVVETALEILVAEKIEKPRLLDLGTGSGCILVALLTELSSATGIGNDVSGRALESARKNAKSHGVEERAVFTEASWEGFGQISETDVIVSNPPYIRKGEINDLQIEVRRHDPHLALSGGEDGLDAYRGIAAAVAAKMRPGAHLVLEIGEGQSEYVKEILSARDLALKPSATRKDLAGIIRVLAFKKR